MEKAVCAIFLLRLYQRGCGKIFLCKENHVDETNEDKDKRIFVSGRCNAAGGERQAFWG